MLMILPPSAFRRTAGFLLLLLSLSAGSVRAGEQAEHAIATVKRLTDSGEVSADSVLRMVVKQGNIANFLGTDSELRYEWEKRTGILIDASIMPQQASLDFIRNHQDVDITIARNREYPALFEQQLISDLTPLLERFEFSLSDNARNGYLLPQLQARLGDRVVAIPADGDMAVLYLRRDLLEDPANQHRFQQIYGYPLRIPTSWEEYQHHVEFFYDADKPLYGALEQRDKPAGWMFWIPRYVSRSLPNQHLFDEQMRPLINSPAGIAATTSYLATVPYSPEKILQEGNNYTYTLPLFLRGQGYSTIITLAGAKLFNRDSSAIRDRFIAVPMPGIATAAGSHHRTTLIYGNNLVIPDGSRNKELALLFAMWLTDPDISVRSLSAKAGFSDPYRYNHFVDPDIVRTYTAQVLNTVRAELSHVVPAGTGLPGDHEYIAALNHNIYLAAAGKQSASEAMEKTATAWQQITDRYGRSQQIQRWKQIMAHYPTTVPRADGSERSPATDQIAQ